MKDKLKNLIKKPSFAIFDEHDLKDEKGNKLYSVDRKVLQQIADNNNKRIRATGDYAPIVIGHTKDDVSEDQQPLVVGYAANYRVEPLFNTGRYAIFVDPYFEPEHIDEAGKYPRRSVEYWPNKKEIDPIALLGATTPERDLGLMQFSRNQDQFHYSRTLEQEMPVEEKDVNKPKKDGDVEKFLAAFEQSDMGKFLKQLMEEVGAMGDEGGDGAAPPMPGGAGPMPPYPGGAMPGAGGPPVREMGVPAAPGGLGGSNGYVPGSEPKRMNRNDDEVIRFQRERQEMYAQYEVLQRDLNDMKMKYRRAEREKDLIELETEGFVFDRDEELDILTPQDDAQYAKSIERIRKRYSRGPVTSDAVRSSQRAVKYNRSRSKEQVDAIVNHATKTGKSYEAAAADLEGQGVL